jgi:hypothetical protein
MMKSRSENLHPTPGASDPTAYSGTHIAFVPNGPSSTGKTFTWTVEPKDGGSTLGDVKWFSRWRKYSLYPAPRCLFEQTCLREIAEFIEDRTREQRTGI